MADPSTGGSYLPRCNYIRTGATDTGGTYSGATLSGATTISGTPTIAGVALSGLNDRELVTDVVAISGTALHAANLTLWTAPAAAIILRVILDITTQSTGASTIDIGYTATTSTTTSDTLLDGVSGAAVATFDSMNAALDSGANAKAQLAASGKWITADEVTGDTSALVGNVYIQYVLV